METTIRDKSFNRDKSIEELQYDSHEWKSKLKFIKLELNFLKFLLNINIFEKGIMNLFETIELFKQDVDNANKKRSKLLDKTNLHISKITKKLECVNIDNNGFFIEIHENLEHEFEVFLEEINNLKLQLFQYIQSVIKKRK
ncbi:MAG: hypothetical protein KAJ28_11180 [Flavobacteriaceae bacterium]|nr:hypothetical protein [Flavobacteriaceae bacterium]